MVESKGSWNRLESKGGFHLRSGPPVTMRGKGRDDDQFPLDRRAWTEAEPDGVFVTFLEKTRTQRLQPTNRIWTWIKALVIRFGPGEDAKTSSEWFAEVGDVPSGQTVRDFKVPNPIQAPASQGNSEPKSIMGNPLDVDKRGSKGKLGAERRAIRRIGDEVESIPLGSEG